MTPKVFISYRRDDAPGSAGRLYDQLAETLPGDNIFMDVDAIVPGVDFVQALDDALAGCDVLLAIIGANWLDARDSDGARRLDSPDDFVRIEIATALSHDVRVVPVLVDGATMPAAADLPDTLQPLARRHAVEISHMRFAMDTDRLARALVQSTRGAEAEPDPEPPTPQARTTAPAPEITTPDPPVQATVEVPPADDRPEAPIAS
ncbi:MAG: toll/interleukin-1 receptor domain-containing protein, partial [Hyphomicrobiales bacterium]